MFLSSRGHLSEGSLFTRSCSSPSWIQSNGPNGPAGPPNRGTSGKSSQESKSRRSSLSYPNRRLESTSRLESTESTQRFSPREVRKFFSGPHHPHSLHKTFWPQTPPPPSLPDRYFTVKPLNAIFYFNWFFAAVFVYFNRFLNIAQISVGRSVLVVHLLLNKVQSTALDELSSVMCLP